MRPKFIIFIWIAFALSTPGCTYSIESVREFNEWLNDEENGCIETKKVSGVELIVKYTPPSFVALKDMQRVDTESEDRVLFDSLRHVQSRLMTFLFTIQPDKSTKEEERASSVAVHDVSDQAEYNERVLATNFFMDQHIKLYIDGTEHKPVLVVVENLYELSPVRNFVVLFSGGDTDKLMSGEEYLFVYDDSFFNLGKVQFAFSGKRLAEARKLEVL